MIFAVLDVSLAVNLCINCSFLHLYLQFYYIPELLQQNCLFRLPSRNIRPNRVVDYPSAFYCTLNTDCSYRIVTGLDHANQVLVFFHLHFLFDST